MTTRKRAEQAAALQRWADNVAPEDLVEVAAPDLQRLAELADQHEALERELRQAVATARRSQRSWSEIGNMLGVSKQAVQRRYGQTVTTG